MSLYVAINVLQRVCCSFIIKLTVQVAEKTFISLRKIATDHSDVHCIAVSHSDAFATAKWTEAVGGAGGIQVIVDHERKLYGAYGLGVSSFWHTFNPWSMRSAFKLGWEEQIWNRPTESGSRWQTAGTFAIDAEGAIKSVKIATSANENGDFEGALEALGEPKM